MNNQNLSLIEQKIIKHKKNELYKELSELASLMREKQYEIMRMAAIGTLDKENIVKDFLNTVIMENEIPCIDDIKLPKETEKYFLEKGINELLNKNIHN
ncbi:MFS transporter [Bacillus sp. Fil]|uniref:MFS transporter n=1 Tax=Bacillus sp. Fil TaxID=3459567 RepID=UPI00403B1A77